MYTVAIVGRPNVGKSTLFNRLIGERKAIVDDISGVTRDRQYGDSEWNGKTFHVIDTGGYVANGEDIFEKEIREQVLIALEESDVIVFVVDVTAGVMGLDEEFAQLLHRSTKPVIVVVNKVDNSKRQIDGTEFYSLGFETIHFISSLSGSGTGDLLDDITALMTAEKEILDAELPKIAIVGQPNAGKSSLLNALVGEQRNIVSEIAGTTRDSIHTRYNLYGKDFILIDTAGLRKKNTEKDNIEFYATIRAVKALEEADVCMLLIDATKGITSQDVNIFSLAARKGKGLVILVNKWDLIEKDTMTSKKTEEYIKEKIKPFTDVPILFVSATEKQRIHKAIETALEVNENRGRHIPTSQLNDIMLKEIAHYPPPFYRGNAVTIKYVSQLPVVVPSFAFYCNHPTEIKEAYSNFLENKLRSHFNFKGIPIRLFFRKK
ncbi:MAG: ribosome biogenesis GTPase Der [Bacteroidetes bacterium]|jgi:GTP-binding protein|nr:ribosome biogenesis GTPase Der [Bacteroidota bacterium]MBK8143903.1 ribosome biogenesis GTPase Der [Bacteroidota bacterium]MBP6314009.1 ribosome biogenesis GTPase Der [Chitinophagaceae bacterium]